MSVEYKPRYQESVGRSRLVQPKSKSMVVVNIAFILTQDKGLMKSPAWLVANDGATALIDARHAAYIWRFSVRLLRLSSVLMLSLRLSVAASRLALRSAVCASRERLPCQSVPPMPARPTTPVMMAATMAGQSVVMASHHAREDGSLVV